MQFSQLDMQRMALLQMAQQQQQQQQLFALNGVGIDQTTTLLLQHLLSQGQITAKASVPPVLPLSSGMDYYPSVVKQDTRLLAPQRKKSSKNGSAHELDPSADQLNQLTAQFDVLSSSVSSASQILADSADRTPRAAMSRGSSGTSSATFLAGQSPSHVGGLGGSSHWGWLDPFGSGAVASNATASASNSSGQDVFPGTPTARAPLRGDSGNAPGGGWLFDALSLPRQDELPGSAPHGKSAGLFDGMAAVGAFGNHTPLPGTFAVSSTLCASAPCSPQAQAATCRPSDPSGVSTAPRTPRQWAEALFPTLSAGNQAAEDKVLVPSQAGKPGASVKFEEMLRHQSVTDWCARGGVPRGK